MLKEGDKAPAFSLSDETGKKVKLLDFKGKKVILYFYPRDNTPGCTRQACALRDQFRSFTKIKTTIYGVSKDSVESHQKFIAKHDLPFSLLSDPEVSLAKAYGAWGEKNMYGKKTMGIIRSTFVIGENGKIEKVYPKVKPDLHADQLLEHLSS